MLQSAAKQFSGIFLSYRRDDSAGHAGRLFDRLSEHFGRERLFMDVDHIEPGEDFVQVIEAAVGSSAVLLVVIGRRWLTSGDVTARRIDNPNDFVRLEVASALASNIRVIPVLVQDATMPGPQDLPDDLLSLTRRNAIELSDLRWNRDVDQLISGLERFFAKQQEAQRIAEQGTEKERQREVETQRQKEEEHRRHQAEQAARETEEKRQREEAEEVARRKREAQEIEPSRAVESVAANMTNRIGIELVWIPPGSFMMGSEKGNTNEKPAHQVTISEGFYLGKYEVTQEQWQGVMGNNPSHFKGKNLPVEEATWDDAIAFIARLNAQNGGYTYRLPSEAEWEYAARAGTTGEYAGDLDAMAWYWKSFGGRSHPVGCKQPNAFGLFDMYGNVWEWCQDWYHNSYMGAPTDGSAWLSGGEQKYRVMRGGSWKHDASYCRSAYRLRNSWISRHFLNVGLRVVAVART